jgi:hypothetical protein
MVERHQAGFAVFIDAGQLLDFPFRLLEQVAAVA